MKKTISIPTSDRPECLRRVLTSIRAARGWQEWMLVFSCEPHQACWEVARGWPGEKRIARNEVRMGCRINTFLAVALAQQLGSSFNLYLEDDVVVSPDALLLAEAFRESGREGLLCLRRWHETQLPRHEEVAPAAHGLLGDGFACHRGLFGALQRHWFHDYPGQGGAMWDWSVDRGLNDEGVRMWRPLVNRSRNIGTQGTHTVSGRDLNHFGPCYDGEPVTKFTFAP